MAAVQVRRSSSTPQFVRFLSFIPGNMPRLPEGEDEIPLIREEFLIGNSLNSTTPSTKKTTGYAFFERNWI